MIRRIGGPDSAGDSAFRGVPWAGASFDKGKFVEHTDDGLYFLFFIIRLSGRPMKLVIHAGMNKTGSSSIQFSLADIDQPDFTYIDWKSANHSELYVLLFEPPEIQNKYHIFLTQGRNEAELEAMQQEWLARVEAQLRDNDRPVTVFSGEDISQPRADALAAQRMRDFFARFFDEIRVIAYARPPLSFVNSTFQQRVKSGGITEIDIDSLWPNYRQRFERFDTVFGRENVEIIPFIPACLHGQDVVTDFVTRAGLDLGSAPTQFKNDSLSLEALALLFAQRKLGRGMHRGFAGATKRNNALIHALSSVGDERFSFSRELMDGLIERHSEDFGWIEDRIGQNLRDEPVSVAHPISCEQDLLDIASREAQAVATLILRKTRKGAAPDEASVTALLDCLRDLC